MEYTVRQLAQKMGLTKEAIYKRIRKNKSFKSNHTKVSHNRLIIDEMGAKKLIGKSNQHIDNQLATISQLRDYKRQVKEQNGQIDRLQALLNQSQQIQLSMQHHYQKLLGEKPAQDSSPKKKGNWLSRLIKRI